MKTSKNNWGFLFLRIFIIMKILIREDKRDVIAKQVLTNEFSGIYEEVIYLTDSNGERNIINYSNGDGVIMVYGDRASALYICEDVTTPLIFLSYTPKEVKDIIGEWFSEFFKLPVNIVHHVNKSVLN